ncbi:MAG: dynamin family protein [Desulfurivibrionaceae bacterium]|nr:dynamin family protein [Desulfobulbales bacterium]MDT8335069.1 dynamin family protein [Desulfurivibrionaceae bacterium]
MTEAQKLQDEIQKKAMDKLAPLFNRYQLSLDYLEPALKWKSMVLILGNFSSGKSTLINEIFETDIQRTGQSPTDDSFTILTGPEKGAEPRELPGSSLINDERLPFTAFKKYGEQFVAHFAMKQFESPHLEDLAIIDSPGMLDAITEKDRGYDYNAVIGELARLADLVVLMFDPHKAGTIREVYETIRNTLPGNSGEDRIVFVMSRIDECDNPGDLIRSYGTLCWNLSQMTGRKDIPRIFLTYSPTLARAPESMAAWANERAELKERILAAPKLRVNHILQHIDKQAHELRMVAETLASFSLRGRQLLRKTGRLAIITGLFLFLFLDIIIREFTGLPETTLISSLLAGRVGWADLLIPTLGAGGALTLFSLFFSRFQFIGLQKRAAGRPEELIELDTEYRRQLWRQVAPHVELLLKEAGPREIFASHQGNLRKIDRFIDAELQDYYRRIS